MEGPLPPPEEEALLGIVQSLTRADELTTTFVGALTDVGAFETNGEDRSGRSSSAVIESVELRLRGARPKAGLVILALRANVALDGSFAERAWGDPGRCRPNQKNPLPSPGSAKEAFDRWQRHSYRTYFVNGVEVRVGFEDDRVRTIVVDRFG